MHLGLGNFKVVRPGIANVEIRFNMAAKVLAILDLWIHRCGRVAVDYKTNLSDFLPPLIKHDSLGCIKYCLRGLAALSSTEEMR